MELVRFILGWLDDRRPDALKAIVWAVPVSLALGAGMLVLGSGMRVGLATTVVTFLLVAGGSLLVSEGAGAATEVLMQQRGSATPSVADYSYEKSLVVRGQVREAIVAYERHIAATPERVQPYLLVAELYQREGDLSRARERLLAARGRPAARPAEVMEATNRLIDLYLGPLDRPADARRELEHLVATFPTTQAAAHARAALGRLPAERS